MRDEIGHGLLLKIRVAFITACDDEARASGIERRCDGSSPLAVGPHAISARAETCLIKIEPCCLDISKGVIPICSQ